MDGLVMLTDLGQMVLLIGIVMELKNLREAMENRTRRSFYEEQPDYGAVELRNTLFRTNAQSDDEFPQR